MQLLIEERWDWDDYTKVKAHVKAFPAFFANFKNFVSKVILENVLHTLREITIRLQKRDTNIRQVYSSQSNAKSDLAAIRAKVDKRFNQWYQGVLDLTKVFGTNEQAPREKKANIHRVTYPAASSKVSWLVISICSLVSWDNVKHVKR